MRRSRKFLCLALTAAAAVIIAKSVLVRAQQGAPAGEWRAYGSDLRATKYSPLTQITGANFGSLQIARRGDVGSCVSDDAAGIAPVQAAVFKNDCDRHEHG